MLKLVLLLTVLSLASAKWSICMGINTSDLKDLVQEACEEEPVEYVCPTMFNYEQGTRVVKKEVMGTDGKSTMVDTNVKVCIREVASTAQDATNSGRCRNWE